MEVISLNSVLWGGIYNPIIKISKSASKYEIHRCLGIIKAFDPDLIINLSGNLPENFSKHIENEIIPRSNFVTGSSESGVKIEYGLHTYLAFNQELPDIGLNEQQKEFLCMLFTKQKGWDLYAAARFGIIQKDKFPRIFDYLNKTVGIPEKHLQEVDFTRIKHNDTVGVLGITRFSLEEYGDRGGFASHLVYIGNHLHKDDILEYWNLRAAGENVFFLPIKNYKEYKETVKDFIQVYSKFKRFNHPDIDLQISPSLIKNKEVFEEIGNWIYSFTKTSLSRRLWLANWGRRHKRIVEDISCVIPYYSRDKILINYTADEIDAFTLSSPKFIEEQFYREKYSWAVDLTFMGFYDSKYTIDLPNQRGMQEIAQRDLVFAGFNRVRVSNHGLVMLCDSKEDVIHINPVPVTKVVEKIFANVGFKITRSTPGIFTNKILQIMGGLEDCRVFKIKGVREALTKLNTYESEVIIDGKKHKGTVSKPNSLLASAIRDIIKSVQVDEFNSQNWVDELYKDIVLYYGQPTPLTPEIVISSLIENKVIVPGLKLRCKECTSEDWYRLGSFNDSFKCNFCFAKQDIPRIDRQQWFYRTQGMVSISDEGRGSIPVILSLWRLSHFAGLGEGKYITSHEVKSNNDDFRGEFDYVYFSLGHFEKDMELVIGEARNYTDFSEKDINKTIYIAKKFKKKPFIAFTTLKDKFSTDEIKLIKKVMKEGFFVLPITRMETDPYDLYDRFDNLRNKYAVTFEDFSVNLCQLNLSMEEKDVYALVEFEERKIFQNYLKKHRRKK